MLAWYFVIFQGILARGSGWGGGGGGGFWYSLFIKNLAHYSSHKNFGLFIKIDQLFIKSKKGGKEI